MIFAAEEHVVIDAEVLDQRQVLVDRLDAVGAGIARRGEMRLLAVDDDRAAVGLVKAREDFDQGGLAGAIVADQRQHLPLTELDADVDERRDGAEALADVAHLEDDGRLRIERRDLLAHIRLRARILSTCTFSIMARMMAAPR